MVSNESTVLLKGLIQVLCKPSTIRTKNGVYNDVLQQ